MTAARTIAGTVLSAEADGPDRRIIRTSIGRHIGHAVRRYSRLTYKTVWTAYRDDVVVAERGTLAEAARALDTWDHMDAGQRRYVGGL